MRAKYFLGAAAAIGLTCAAGIDVPPALSSLAGTALAKAHGHKAAARSGTHKPVRQAKAGHRKAQSARAKRDEPKHVAALQPPPAERVAAPAAPVNEDERRSQLQHALEARAQQIATARSAETTGSLPQNASTSGGANVAPVQPRSVSFDFESGLKTTVYPGDRVVREGFDVAAARNLAATPPSETVLARAKP
jgi:hypothetical protein